ncbi:hypothetical protein [Sinorhizobium medicae]|uniref:hypothetical protein n=1 Tax=Sinorhizobium medicae TaxID=110321 RepID=UPI000FD87395|nr:hypothetical protein [Sinorhizobium medicae]RVP45205.1 hypothetical protein CN078_30795 [Sinorhizobium medicae]RVP68945.1 hypothetical protein CN079_30615 [Sinorhizobium medicae]UWU12345.1 hypothetical protein N2598_31665 [Sinorhizobium medicae]
MISKSSGMLGIIELAEGLSERTPVQGREGSLLNPATFGLPIITEIVQGAFAEKRVMRGNPLLEGACVTAAQRLVERGASVIVGDCGF